MTPTTALPATHWDVDLPYSSPPLRANDRMHWAVKNRIVAQIRRDTHHMARFLRLPTGLETIEVQLIWQPNVSRRRDRDGLWPTLKAAIDGLVDYKLVPDDDVTHVWSGCEILPVAQVARVWLRITDRGGK